MSAHADPTTIGADLQGEGGSAPAYLTRQHRRYRHRPTEWWAVAGVERRGLADTLLGAATRGTERIMLCGPVDRDALDRIALATPPDGWRVADRGHYLASAESATLRWARDDDGATVELVSALAWFGRRRAATCESASLQLHAELERAWGESLPMLATPSALGRDLILRSLPQGESIPNMDADTRAWWQSVTTQGRWQLCDHGRDRLPQLVTYDQRFSYGGHCWELGVPPVTWEHDATGNLPVDVGRRGLYRVTWRVPAWWDHVGLAGVADSDGATWRWPDRPLERHTTWMDGSEAQLLTERGWIESIDARATLQQGRPLDTWARRLVAARNRLAARYTAGDDAVAAAADGLRMLLLTAIGALHGRGHTITRTVPRERAQDVPADARDVRVTEGGQLVWTEQQAPGWEAMAHPEWTGQIWARSRRRVLTHRDGIGALHVDRRDVVAIRGDALHLAFDPMWPVRGRPGELRRTDTIDGPLAPPDSLQAVHDYKSHG